jgi:hypothetical protein
MRAPRPLHSNHSSNPPKNNEGVIKRAVGWFLSLVAILTGIGSICDFYTNSTPLITAQTAQLTEPFAAHFSLHNSTHLFHMNLANIRCALIPVRTNKNAFFGGFALQDSTPPIDLSPNETKLYTCPMNTGFPDLGSIKDAQISVVMQYAISFLGYRLIDRPFSSPVFHWDEGSKQWIEGTAVN